jgi:hypothetical protein
MIALTQRKVVARAGSAAMSGAFCHARDVMLPLLMAATLAGVYSLNIARAEEPSKPAASMEPRVKALIPDLEAYIQRGMKAFDAPGLDSENRTATRF